MTWLGPAVSATLLGAVVLALVYGWVYAVERRPAVGLWAASWCVYALRFVVALVILRQGATPWLLALHLGVTFASGLLLLAGTLVFLERRIPRWSWGVVAVLGCWLPGAALLRPGFIPTVLPYFLLLGSVYILTGTILFRQRRTLGWGAALSGIALVVWGLHKLNYPFLRPIDWLAPWGFLLGAVLALVTAFGLLFTFFEQVRGELRQRQAELTTILRHSDDHIFLVDAELRLVAMSDRFRRDFGAAFGREPVAGDLLFEGVPAAQGDGWRAPYRAALAGEAQHYDLSLDTPSGPRQYEVSLSPATMPGRGSLVSAIARDVTTRRRAEAEAVSLREQLLQAQKMEAVGRLAGGIAHDFNNLLTGILGNANLMQLDLPNVAGLRESLAEIETSARRAADLTAQLLAFSRKQPSRPEAVDLGAELTGTSGMLQRLIGETIDLGLEVEPGCPPARVDRAQLGQVLMNLAVNARDAMPKGGRLTLRAGRCTQPPPTDRRAPLGLDAPDAAGESPPLGAGSFVCLEVEDQGDGISAEALPHLFEPFFTTKPVGRGTGLGLATVYGIVRQHGGWVDVDTTAGAGSCFRVHLPVALDSPAALADEGDLVADSSPTGQRILLVEDEAAVRHVAKELLRRLGYEVLCASNGQEALLRFEEVRGEIALLLTDVVMPGMSGQELAEALRLRRPDLPVLFTSGYPDKALSFQGGTGTALDFLPKPFHQETLGAAVANALGRVAPRTTPG